MIALDRAEKEHAAEAEPRRQSASRRARSRTDLDAPSPGTELRELVCRERMNVALAAFAFVPGLAIGSFLNVVAARVPRGARSSRRGSSCMSCAHADRLVRQHPGRLVPPAPRPLPALRRTRSRGVPGGRARDGAARRGLRLEFGCDAGRPRRRGLLRRPRHDRGHRSRAPDHPEQHRAPRGRRRPRGADELVHPSVAWSDRRPPPGRSPAPRRARLSGRDRHGRREARAAARCRTRHAPCRSRCSAGMLVGARPVGRAARAPRPGGAEDGDPVRAVPRARRRRRALRRATRSSTRTWASSNEASKMESSLISGSIGGEGEPEEAAPTTPASGDAELVADVIRETGLLEPEQIDSSAQGDRRRLASRRPLEEGSRRPRRRAAARRGATAFRSSTWRSTGVTRGDQDDRAARCSSASARSRSRATAHPPDRDHEPAGRPRHRRAAARHAAHGRVRGRRSKDVLAELRRLAVPNEAIRRGPRRHAYQATRTSPTTSRPRTASRTPRSSGSSTR